MARVQYGAVVTELEGSVGGFTFQRNSSGSIVRARPTQSKTSTPKQTLAQSKHATILNQWQRLTLSQKEMWNDYAALYTKVNAFGQDKKLTGLNWYESINQVFDQLGITQVEEPPAHFVPSGVPSFSIEITALTLKVIFDPVFTPTDEDLSIWTTQPVTRVTANLRNEYRSTAVVTGDNYGTIDITSAWSAAHGIPWPPTSNVACFTIGVLIRSCSRDSGICSVGTTNVNSFATFLGGIGAWIVGSTFTVE